MMYEFHKGDVKTVDKYKRIERARSIDRKTLESAHERSMQSSKGNPPSVCSNDDINPKLSMQDTPVSGAKVLKPGSRRKQAALSSTSPVPARAEDQEPDFARAPGALQSRAKAEVRFREALVEEEELRRQQSQAAQSGTLPRSRLQVPLKSSISPRVQTHRTQLEEAADSRGFFTNPDHEGLHRSLQHEGRPGSSRGKPREPLGHGALSQVDGNLSEEDPRQLQKSRSRDMIRNDSIQRLKKLSAVNSNSARLGRSLSREKPKPDLTDKFFFLREKKKADRASSRNGSPEPRNPPRATTSTQELAPENRDLSLHERDHTDIKIDEVSAKKLEGLLAWLRDLGYLKYYRTLDDLPTECRNGSLFFKLINHLERATVLKGENTSSKTAVRVNFEKIFAHLKRFEKFNPRYLNSEYYLMKGQKEVFWGFVDDIRHVYGNKISFRDRRFSKKASRQGSEHPQSKERSGGRRGSGLSYSQSPRPSRSGSRQNLRQPALKGSASQKDFPTSALPKTKAGKPPAVQPQRKQSIEFEAVPTKPLPNAPRKEAAVVQSIPSFGRFVDLENTTNTNLRKLRVDSKNLAELEEDCREWFEVLGYRVNYKDSMFENQLRNGFLLCTIVALVFKKPIRKVCKEPKSVSECRNNIESALNVVRAANSPIPYELLWQGDELLKGNPSVTWQLFSSLKYLHMTGSAADSKVNLNRAANLSSVNMKTLPYTEPQIAELSASLLGWFISLGVFNTDLRLPTCIEDVVEQVAQGAVLAKAIFKVTGQVLRGIHVKPRSRPNYIFNVSKCLDYLKTVPGMSRKFLWKTEDIVNCQKLSIIGLLEDLHLLADGHPQRKDPNYFADGPYIRDYDLADLLKRQSRAPDEESSRLHSETGPHHGSEADNHLNNLNRFRLPKSEQRKAPTDSEILQIINNKAHSSSKLDDRLLADPKTLQQLMDERPCEFEIQPLNNTFGLGAQPESPTEADNQGPDFEQVKKVIRLLLTLNLPKVVEREAWNSSVWTLFSDG